MVKNVAGTIVALAGVKGSVSSNYLVGVLHRLFHQVLIALFTILRRISIVRL